MVGRALFCAVALTACGRLNFDFGGDPSDGPTEPADLWPDAPMLGVFGTPSPVPNLDSSSEDDDPTLPGDQLEIFFASGRNAGIGGEGDIFTSTRTTSSAWSVPIVVPGLDTGQDETNPEITIDGLTMYFSRAATQNAPHDLFFMTRPDRTSTWSAPQPVTELNTSQNESAASPDPDHLALTFERAGKFLITTRATTADAWSTPIEIDFGTNANQAWLGKTMIYFTGGASKTQIWAAIRTGPTTFGPASVVTELNVSGANTDPWLSADLSTIYFTHNDVIEMATR